MESRYAGLVKRMALVPALVLALALGACGSSSSSSSSASSSPVSSSTSTSATTTTSPASGSGKTVQVAIKNLAFQPKVVDAKVGQTVRWTNSDLPAHNITYVSGPKFKSSPTLDPGKTFQIKLTKAGTIKYFCSIHPFMKATIVVAK